MRLSRMTGIGMKTLAAKSNTTPVVSFHSLHAKSNNGQLIDFKVYCGKKILLVNLASQCGYTPQYAELQKLQDQYSKDLIILGFPSNDFAKQEPGNDEDIESFCRINYGITFTLFRKDQVTGPNSQPVYQWLSRAALNGWNNQEPTWNFCKYLVNENGQLLYFYSSSISPLSDTIVNILKNQVL